jgi:large subunit ribosomal protein L3
VNKGHVHENEPITKGGKKMEKFILGKKIGMTQIFDEAGKVIPVTVIQAGPCTVIQKKTVEDHGYEALQVGYEDIDAKKLNKPEKGYFDRVKLSTKKFLREFRVDDIAKYQVGQEVKVEDMFAKGDKIDVAGTSKGKGFQGVIKRHGFSRGPETHGSNYHRRPGSMGGCSYPGRVFKGKKLPGHMGMEKVSVLNLQVVGVDGENKLLLVKGAVPGTKGALLTIKNSVKVGK